LYSDLLKNKLKNTPESFELLKNILIESDKAGFIPQRRCLTYAAALAIKQNDPQWALNILGGIYD